MIFLLLKSIADDIELHFLKGIVMALGVVCLLSLIIFLIFQVRTVLIFAFAIGGGGVRNFDSPYRPLN